MSNSAQTVSTHASGPMVDKIDAWAKRLGLSRSAAIRDLIRLGLEGVDLWPPKPADQQAA